MELVRVGERTFYIKNATNIGVYKVDNNDVYIIDSGNDKDCGRKILKIINEQGWNIKGIINTHSNADHIGGNNLIQDRTNCIVLANNTEKAFTEFPTLEPSFLYGGYPFKDIRNKFLLAKESRVNPIKDNLPDGLEYFSLKGHFFDMVGIKTSDNVYFLADSLFSEETINKYHLFFIYDVRGFLETLEYLRSINKVEDALYLPAHCEAMSDMSDLIEINSSKVLEIIDKICSFCESGRSFEEILKYVFDEYGLIMNANQYVLIGSTIRSYLSYLCDEGKLEFEFKENVMLWKRV